MNEINVPAAGNVGTRHVWQKHCNTESRTNPINISSLGLTLALVLVADLVNSLYTEIFN